MASGPSSIVKESFMSAYMSNVSRCFSASVLNESGFSSFRKTDFYFSVRSDEQLCAESSMAVVSSKCGSLSSVGEIFPLSGNLWSPPRPPRRSRSRRSWQRYHLKLRCFQVAEELCRALNSVYFSGAKGVRRKRIRRRPRRTTTSDAQRYKLMEELRLNVRRFCRAQLLFCDKQEERSVGTVFREGDYGQLPVGLMPTGGLRPLSVDNIALPELDGGRIDLVSILPEEWHSVLESAGMRVEGPAPPSARSAVHTLRMGV